MEIANLQDVLSSIPPEIVKRGLVYYEVGAVKSMSYYGDAFRAIVRGTRDYEVFLEFSGNPLTAFDCTCPYVR